MNLMSSEKVSDLIDNIIHLDTQEGEYGIDLTVSKIYRAENSGDIDFGGSERKDAQYTEINPELRDQSDKYGWWELDPGMYLMEYNESIESDSPVIIQPLDRLLRNLTLHPTIVTTDVGLMPIEVNGEGISIKENSRVSRALSINNG